MDITITLNISTLVKGNIVTFSFFRQGVFYYNIKAYPIKSSIYQFPVPLEDIGTATLLHQDKAITFMRWIRKAIEDKTLIKIN